MDLAYEPGHAVALQRPRASSCWARSWSGWRASRSRRSRGERILDPLGMKDTLYRPGPELLPRIAPTESDPWRGRLLRGEVHDENAFALGGVAPHAGLFGTAPDLARFAQMLLNGGVLRAPADRLARDGGAVHAPGRRARLDAAPSAGTRPASDELSAGRAAVRRAPSATPASRAPRCGSTPSGGCSSILLTNRVHPTRENNAIRAGAPATWPTRWCAALGAPWHRRRAPGRRPRVARVARRRRRRAGRARRGSRPERGGGRCAGKPARPASCTRVGDRRRPARGRRAARAGVRRACGCSRPSTVCAGRPRPGRERRERRRPGERPAGREPVRRKTQPAAADLRGLDALVVDLQDAGVRFYTYASTMLLCLEAAAEAGIERRGPRPAEPARRRARRGPAARPGARCRDARQPRAGTARPRPHARRDGAPRERRAREAGAPDGRADGRLAARHELAATPAAPGSRRRPNLRSAEAALAYPGTCLLEATNAPRAAAPTRRSCCWARPGSKRRALARRPRAGLRAGADDAFTPRASAAAPDAEAPRRPLPGRPRASDGRRARRGRTRSASACCTPCGCRRASAGRARAPSTGWSARAGCG